jgi:sigma-B regulation protein RsbU (phosphoserine phosphatase)
MTSLRQSDNTDATSPARVLVVDDNEDKRYLLRSILSKSFTVLEADSGIQALTLIGDALPDVVLLDVLMPEPNGFEVCRRMKADPRMAEIPVLFVSVLDPDQHGVQGLELGAEDFINWPVNAADLVARIHARMRSYRPLNMLRDVVLEQSRQIEEDRRREAEREFELEQARRVQQRFLTNAFPVGRGLVFAHDYRPSRMVGGDMFDVIAVREDEVAIMMADVSGHGLAAALLTSVAKVLFRTGAEQCPEPAKLLRWLNRQISAYLATGEFLTVFLALWNARTHDFAYAGAGHPPALLITPGNSGVERLDVSPGIVGVMPDGEFLESAVQLRAGQRVVCYTDGITEAMNDKEMMFGERGLADACVRWGKQPFTHMVECVLRELDRFLAGAPQRDDQAMLALEVTDRGVAAQAALSR